MAIEFHEELQPMAQGGVWLQPHSVEVPPTYVVHEAHIRRLTLDGWRPVTDPRSELMAAQAVRKAAEEKERQDKEEAQSKRIAELEAMVQKLLSAQAAPSESKAEEPKQTSTRRKAE